jgi:hypothetical protein
MPALASWPATPFGQSTKYSMESITIATLAGARKADGVGPPLVPKSTTLAPDDCAESGTVVAKPAAAEQPTKARRVKIIVPACSCLTVAALW